VDILSGQCLNPGISLSVLSGFAVFSVGETLVFRCLSKSLAYSLICNEGMSAVPSKICFVNSLVHSLLINVWRGLG